MIGGGGEALQALNLAPKRRVRAVQECVEIIRLVADGQRRESIYPDPVGEGRRSDRLGYR